MTRWHNNFLIAVQKVRELAKKGTSLLKNKSEKYFSGLRGYAVKTYHSAALHLKRHRRRMKLRRHLRVARPGFLRNTWFLASMCIGYNV